MGAKLASANVLLARLILRARSGFSSGRRRPSGGTACASTAPVTSKTANFIAASRMKGRECVQRWKEETQSHVLERDYGVEGYASRRQRSYPPLKRYN